MAILDLCKQKIDGKLFSWQKYTALQNMAFHVAEDHVLQGKRPRFTLHLTAYCRTLNNTARTDMTHPCK